MAESVSIHLFGDTFFRRRITAMRYRARDMSPVLDDIAQDWVAAMEEQFATEGKRSGHAWAPLARDTYLRRGSKHPILVETGEMLIEMTGEDNIDVTDDSITMHLPSGVEERAAAHQFGFVNDRTGQPVPARPMIDFTDFDVERWSNKITDYLVNGDE